MPKSQPIFSKRQRLLNATASAPHRHHKVLLISGYLAEAQGDLAAAQRAFAESWQQVQGQSYFSSATLIGLGRVALHREDWSAARQYLATAFPLIEKLETAPQALEALACIAHLQQQAGQLEQALALNGLVREHPSSYQESKDRLTKLEAELQTNLSPEQVKIALGCGQASELWDTVAVVQAELGPEDVQSAFRPAVLSSTGRGAGQDAGPGNWVVGADGSRFAN